MKNILILVLLITSSSLFSQNFEVRVSEVQPATNPRSVVIEMRGLAGQMPLTNLDVLDVVVSLRWEIAAGIDLGAPSGAYNMAKLGSGETQDGLNEQQIMAATSTPFKFPNDWIQDTWYPIVTLDVMNGEPGDLIVVIPDGISTKPALTFADEAFSFFVADEPVVNGAAILPIKLTSFTANKFEDIHAKLDWSSSSEINGSHFEIERSVNTQDWKMIGTVNAKGEISTKVDYKFLDENVGVLRSNITYYYRLKMVDLDGAVEYSQVRSVTFTASGVSINVYPNPTSEKVNINMISEVGVNGTITDANITMRNSNGKILLKNKISSNGITEIDLNNVPSGLILLEVEHNNELFTKKIIKVD